MTEPQTENAVQAPATDAPGTAVVALGIEDKMSQYSGRGLENLTAQDMTIPRLNLLQDLSPQVKKTRAEYVEGAEPGMMLNTITNRIYKNDDGVTVIPVYWEKSYTEWKPNRGGFAGRHGPEILNQVQRVNNKDTLPNGNELQVAADYYVLILNADGTVSPALMTMKSTNMKVSKKLTSLLNSLTRVTSKGDPYTPPMFASVVNFTSVMEQDDQNQWFLFKPTWKGYIDELHPDKAGYLIDQGIKLYESIVKGQVKVQEDLEETGGAQSTGADAGTPADDSEDEIPF